MFPSVSTYFDAHSFNIWLALGLCAVGATGHLVLLIGDEVLLNEVLAQSA